MTRGEMATGPINRTSLVTITPMWCLFAGVSREASALSRCPEQRRLSTLSLFSTAHCPPGRLRAIIPILFTAFVRFSSRMKLQSPSSRLYIPHAR